MNPKENLNDFIASMVLLLGEFAQDECVRQCDDESRPYERTPEDWLLVFNSWIGPQDAK